MNEHRTVAFRGFERQIRHARLTQSAVIGEAIGNGLVHAWCSAQRLGIALEVAMAARYAALKRLSASRQPREVPRRVATPH